VEAERRHLRFGSATWSTAVVVMMLFVVNAISLLWHI
jgi:hypothetical protein